MFASDGVCILALLRLERTMALVLADSKEPVLGYVATAISCFRRMWSGYRPIWTPRSGLAAARSLPFEASIDAQLVLVHIRLEWLALPPADGGGSGGIAQMQAMQRDHHFLVSGVRCPRNHGALRLLQIWPAMEDAEDWERGLRMSLAGVLQLSLARAI